MPTNVIMPQMGESIYEGTVTKWLKKVGDRVKRDEPLFEISTDKVDSEIPAPVSGVVQKILVPEGQTVPIKTVVAIIAEEGKAGVEAPAPAVKATSAKKETTAQAPPPLSVSPAHMTAPPVTATATPPRDGGRIFSSPLVRRIARQENINLAALSGKGSGWKGRITKKDILGYVEQRKGATATAEKLAQAMPPTPKPITPTLPPSMMKRPTGNVEVIPMTVMRQKIAEHMVMSKRTSAHVTTVFEVDLSRLTALYEKEKDAFARELGTKLTYTHFFAKAVVDTIKEFPIVNSSVDGTNIVMKRDIHLGIAVALAEGLIVPVVKNAEEKNFLGLARAINDIAERARTKKLAPDDVQGGTFTMTNPGVYGGLFGTPIISQPQVAILGIGGVKKRPVVIETAQGDMLAIKPMVYLALSFDHRVLDGAVSDQFMARLKQHLENWNQPIR